jgi:hypothetical protein
MKGVAIPLAVDGVRPEEDRAAHTARKRLASISRYLFLCLLFKRRRRHGSVPDVTSAMPQ